MPVLAYCVALPDAIAPSNNLNWFEVEGLRCYYADVANINANAAETALQFHRINTALFQAGSILPFRFPTTAATLEELKQNVASRAEHLRNALERLQDGVQFELTFSLVSEAPSSAKTGSDYLRQAQAREKQLAEARERVQSATADRVLRWKESTRGRDLRLFALMERGFQQGFSQILQSVALPNGVECRVVGPWPATEFVDE